MTFLLTTIRDLGWSVAVHNDYKLGDKQHTFWLFTNGTGAYVKGEAMQVDGEMSMDEKALAMCLNQIRAR